MTFTRPTDTLKQRAAPVGRWVALAALCAGLLAACGGSTSQIDPFIPKRLLVFGDDASTLTQTNRNYSVNAVTTTGAIDCSGNPIWVQQLANQYAFEFAECNPTSKEPQAFMRAFAGAKVADVAAQVEAQVAAGGFRDKDMATVFAGMNDIFELYEQYPSRSVDALTAEAGARGAQLAQVVNRLVALGVKVIVSDMPDLGLSPYARAQKALDPFGMDRAAFITKLSKAFSDELGVKIVLDGRYVGLMQSQLRFSTIALSPGSFGLSNIVEGVCTVGLPNCTSLTLLDGAIATQYLWADDTRLGPGGHTQLTALAVARARGNPF